MKGRSVLLLMVAVMAVVTPVLTAAIDDLAAAASDHKGYHGRVQMKVYRGPSKGYGYYKFAPWGYWVKQPADDHAKHHYGGYDDHH